VVHALDADRKRVVVRLAGPPALTPEISVVIPTHDRLEALHRVVEALETQRDAPACELIIVDDGSSDGTAEWLKRYPFRLPTQVVSQGNRGPAAARNRGIDLAGGRLVAFLGDDTIPDSAWLAAHARAHRDGRTPHAVIGYTRWHERLRLTPFLRHINEYGLQFGYALIQDRKNVPFNFFYSSNVSLPRELLLAERFDERFPHAAWEDIELGYRLTRDHGVRLAYVPDAIAAHDHPTTLRRFMERQEKVGHAAVVFASLHPELDSYFGVGADGPPPLPPRAPQVLREWVALAAESLPIRMPRIWDELLRYHYIRGLHRGWRERETLIGKDAGPTRPAGARLETSVPPPERLRVDPFLHLDADQVYNPILDRRLTASEPGYQEIARLVRDEARPDDVTPATRNALYRGGWLVADDPGLSQRFRLKYVSLEAHTVCNQACYFCPVSIAPRVPHFMPDELYARIVRELTDYRDDIETVFMINYNEPTADRRFVDQARLLKTSGLRPAVLTNGSGLTPDRVDALVAMGGLRFLSVNLSTLDRQRYAADRGVDQLELVLRNLDYAKDRAVAAETDLVVLGQGDDRHRQDFEAIRDRFAGSRFNVKYFEVMDRAGYLPIGLRPAVPHQRLCGCENVGSRPLQHLHITPHGRCVLCCEDYSERYVVGDLTKESVTEVLTGPAMAQMRRWVYGVEPAPRDFICRGCVFARTR